LVFQPRVETEVGGVLEKRMLRGKFGFKKEDRADWLKP
jgi:hypothetical protein